MLSALSVQAEVDELKGELEEEQFLSLISAPVAPPSQLASLVAPGAAPEAASEAALEVEELKAMLATAEVALVTEREQTRVAHAEARLSTEAEKAATGAQVKELKSMLATAREEARVSRQVALASAEAEEAAVQALEEAPKLASRTITELRAREEARVAREVARVSIEAKVTAIGTINALRSHVAQLEHKLEVARDVELRRTAEEVQWVTCRVALGEHEEADQLGWECEHPSPPTERGVNADELLGPVRDSAFPTTQQPPRYRRTQSINTTVRASPLAIRARSHSPEYRQESTLNWLRAAAKDDINDINDVSALSRSAPHQDMIELVRDVEACRQWVAYHVARGEYKDAVELGWDGTNPRAPTEQELLEANLAEYSYAAVKDEQASSRDEYIEVTARPLTNSLLQNMIEGAAHAPNSSTYASSTAISQQSRAAHCQLVDEYPVHLTILERQASFLKSAKKNERLEKSANNEASARVNERLERARKHNKQVARLVAASTTMERHARGHLTRVRLRRKREL